MPGTLAGSLARWLGGYTAGCSDSGRALRNSAMQITLSAGHTTHHPQKESSAPPHHTFSANEDSSKKVWLGKAAEKSYEEKPNRVAKESVGG